MMAEAKRKADLKVIILGDYSVGKTAFIGRYIDGTFQTKEPTIGAAFFLKQWGPYNVAVWDTAGDERYTGLSTFYCRNAGAAILAFDMTRLSSYESLWARFLPLLDSCLDNCIKVVVGMKSDLIDSETREVTVEEASKFARELNEKIDISKLPQAPYFETSSLHGTNVNEVFDYIFKHCLPLTEAEYKMMNSHESSTVNLSGNSNAPKKKCC